MGVLVLAAAATATMPLHAEVRTPARCADRAAAASAADRSGVAFAEAGPARLQRLDRLPPAAEVLTVFRTVDGCPRPVVVRYGIGAAATGGR